MLILLAGGGCVHIALIDAPICIMHDGAAVQNWCSHLVVDIPTLVALHPVDSINHMQFSFN